LQWRRSSLIVLQRNPGFREQRYDSHPAPEDATGQAMARQFNGRLLPMIDRLEFAVIEASQPTWLSFLSGDFELVTVPAEFTSAVAPGGKLAPRLARQGMQLEKVLRADHTYTYFNMEDPVLGGYTPDRIALRRALSLAYNNEAEVTRVRQGLGIPATSFLVPHTQGYDPKQNFGFSEYSPARAKALLDLYGYVDKDGDGWRDLPDGKPLTLEYSTTTSADYRELNEIWKKNMDAIGIRVEFKYGQWPELLKASRNGKLMMWVLGLSGGSPDGAGVLALGFSESKGQQNHARFSLPEYDDIYRQINRLPDGPERKALVDKAIKILVAYMPYKFVTHRIVTDLTHPAVQGYVRHPIARDFWKYIDIVPPKASQP
jgi:ABC-type transport system substrate-binding protein